MSLLGAVKAPLRAARNAYYRRWPALRRALTGRRRILLYVNNQAMSSHIWRYYECVQDERGLDFSLYEPEGALTNAAADVFEQNVAASRIRRCKHPGFVAWDLIVCADMRTPASFTREMTPLLYVNHGLHIVSMDGGARLYCYGDSALDERGQPKFTRMLESNRHIVREMATFDPRFAPRIVWSGFKFAGSIADAVAARAEIRRRMGVPENVCLVGFFGTWREHSLFHALGPGLFDACEALRPEGYQFLFSIHPKEYGRYAPDIEPMGELVESQRARGMLVRSPGEPFEPAMAACDIVVSDYSSMAESAIIAGRKLVFSPYPDGMVWKRSLTAEARRALPTLPDVSRLREVLDAVRAAPLDPFIADARLQLVRADHDQVVRDVTRELLQKEARRA